MGHKFWEKCKNVLRFKDKARALHERAVAVAGPQGTLEAVMDRGAGLVIAAGRMASRPSDDRVYPLAVAAAQVEIALEQLDLMPGFPPLKARAREFEMRRLKKALEPKPKKEGEDEKRETE